MKIILDMVTSLNGFIAREDGNEDWLPEEGWEELVEQAIKLGNIVMGRKTYEQIIHEGYNFDNVKCTHKIIVTHDKNFIVPEGYMIAHSPEEAITFIESQGLSELLLIGGGKLNGEFAKRGLIDEIQFTINPYIIGKGIPVFGDNNFEMRLELIDYSDLSNGRIRVRYKVAKLIN
jgi:dihydrofolate reductase